MYQPKNLRRKGLRMTRSYLLASLTIVLALLGAVPAAGAAPLSALIVTGQNNHDWAMSAPILQQMLENSGLFTVTTATSSPAPISRSTPRNAGYSTRPVRYTFSTLRSWTIGDGDAEPSPSKLGWDSMASRNTG